VKTELGIQIENDSSSYDSYVYPVNHDDGTQEFTYKIPLSDFNTLPDKLILKAEVAAWKEPGLKPGKLITALAKNLNLTEQKYLIEYYFQECDLVNEECPVNFQFGFGMPSVEVASSFSFNELGMEDWEWGYAHEIIDERLFRLPIKKDDDESAEILGQVTVMIDNDIAYVYFQMNDGYPMNKTGLYFSSTRPESGVPCDYTYNTEFTNPDGTWAPVLTYMYTINDLSQMLGTTSTGDDDNDDQKLNPFWIIAYTDFFE
jgi:hypothetical protein